MNIKDYVFNNFGLKLTALFLAIFVWIMISGKERAYSEKTIDVNIEYFNVSKNIDVRSVSPEKVRIKVKGTSKEINKISLEDFKLKIDLKGTNESAKINRFAKDYLDYPENVSIESVYPQWIEIAVEEFDSKDVSVRVIYKGRFKKGIKLVSRRIIPEKVRIFGYKSQIDKINTVYGAGNIDLSNIEESKTITIPLKKRKEILRFEDLDEVKVLIVVENINKKSEKK